MCEDPAQLLWSTDTNGNADCLPGIKLEDRRKLFEPTGRGGTVFTVFLPAVQVRAQASSSSDGQ
jgi:hypothetical protein